MTIKTKQVESIKELYADRTLYSSKDMFSPPSERLDHVIRFELTEGCNYGKCTYCEGFDGVKHRVKDLYEYKAHVDEVWNRIGKETPLVENLRRIFIGGGNALEVETEVLNQAIQYTAEKFLQYTGKDPKRIALYGRTDSVLKQGKEGLKKLSTGGKSLFKQIFSGFFGLNLIYWGVESGSSNVLDYVHKGYTQEDILNAANTINSTFIGSSVMIMPGLGGIKFYEEHAEETAKVLGHIRPKYITFMGINPSHGSCYSKFMQQEIADGTNRPLTDFEMGQQMIEIINKMPNWLNVKVGCFPPSIDKVGYNPLNFGSENLDYLGNKKDIVSQLTKKNYLDSLVCVDGDQI